MSTEYILWHQDPAPKIAAERGIAREVLRNLLKAGYALCIDNGGDEYEIAYSHNFTELFENLSASDSDYIEVCVTVATGGRPKYKRVGYVLLVYGNDPWELIADYTTNLEATIAPALERERRSEARFA